MIVDIHTHIFSRDFIARRESLAARDAGFAELYANPRAKMATAEDLLESMDTAGVDVSVACGFWWADPAIAKEHAAYLAEAAHASEGRIVAFVPSVDVATRAHRGMLPTGETAIFASDPGVVAGIGEVRVADPAGFPASELPVLAHCTEEAGHSYPGKSGGLTPGALWAVLESQPEARVIAAHWGGGLPWLALMPELRAIIDAGRLLVDTAASAYLYDPRAFRAGIELMGAQAVAWGSDFPLRSQSTDLAEARVALSGVPEATRDLVLGGNAARFLGLTPAPRSG